MRYLAIFLRISVSGNNRFFVDVGCYLIPKV
jgi:hypothetical protein